MTTDVTIVGAGPAGSALAIELGRRGLRVVLYEKARFPRLKPCGEGLLPHGVAALQAIAGLPPAPRVRGLRFVAGAVSLEADFATGFGLVVRRDRFDTWLFARAARTPNVDARAATPYRSGHTRFLVGADGARSMFHRRMGASDPRPLRAGLSTHMIGIEDLGERVEIFFHDDGELYVAPTGGGEALVTALFDYRRFRRDGIAHLLASIPELRRRSRGAEHTTAVLAAAPLGRRVARIVDPEQGLLLVGDAAGSPDPITGEGMALALASIASAADAIESGNLGTYARRRRRSGRTADRLGRLLLHVSCNQRRAARALERKAGLIPELMAVATGERRLSLPTLVRAAL